MNQASVDYKKESRIVINRLLIASTFINVGLTIVKYFLGKWIGNVALQADALAFSFRCVIQRYCV